MKQIILCLIFILTSTISQAQIKFEKGRIVKNTNEKVDCLIKNEGWLNTPSIIQYRLSEDGPVITVGPKDISSFEVGGQKYLSFKGDVDTSSDQIEDLTSLRNPKFETKTIFIKVLEEGDASLYGFQDGVKRFFFSVNNVGIKQLVYKRFYNADRKVATNNYFKQQIAQNLKCASINESTLKNIEYNEKDLINIFRSYNGCRGNDIKESRVEVVSKGKWNIYGKAGLNLASLSLERPGNLNAQGRTVDFDNSTGLRIGVEVEYSLPFNKNKWAVFVNPSFTQFNSEKEYFYKDYTNDSTVFKAEYKALEIPVGIRYYMFISSTSKIHLNLVYAPTIDMGTEVYDDKGIFDGAYDLDLGSALGLGIGYNWNNKVSAEIRHYFSKSVVSGKEWDSDYQSLNITVGYNFL